MNSSLYAPLRKNVSLLGSLLGDTMCDAYGEGFLEKIEKIRNLSKSARLGDEADKESLQELLRNLSKEELAPVSRAFSQFLNLANIADQHHAVSRGMDTELSSTKTLANAFAHLDGEGRTKDEVVAAINALHIELVLTAHPTEITRRTLIHKHQEIDFCLSQLELSGLTPREEESIQIRLRELVAQIWHTTDFRRERPTPVDEAGWGFAVVENSLWDEVPDFLRRLDKTLFEATGTRLPIDAKPVSFSSWMGGDRDGNPYVTAAVTSRVLLISRWQAANLYYNDVDELTEELSMNEASATLAELSNNAPEPYRVVLRALREKLGSTRDELLRQLDGKSADPSVKLISSQELWETLHACYQSLQDTGMAIIANGKLLNLLRRVRCFGTSLVSLDIRQHSERHAEVFSELTRYLGMGDYDAWTEDQKCEFLLAELASKRPLIPSNWQPSEDVQEVLDTCATIARQEPGALKCYIISMARQPSDILAVELLLKASGVNYPLPVVPLFETLDDLSRSAEVIERLLNIPDYLQHLNGQLMVMIGYSDSAKDAGVLAAAWAQYTAQESLLDVCEQANVKLTLFHGRGGTIGRGGAPAHDALLSQPPGSLANGLRVTEQGEMIRTKLGMKGLATKTLSLYTSAILQANLAEPPKPKRAWRDIMDSMAETSCGYYRAYVQENPDFVAYFRQATPELELGRLPLGSRPSSRKQGGGIESLRAIPWIFAWMQNRLMLPAWLGAGQALAKAIEDGQQELLKEMSANWPFFATRLSMLEMVFAKSDTGLSEYYDQKLVTPELSSIGKGLREQLAKDTKVVLKLIGEDSLLEDNPWSKESIQLRNVYTDPLNVLQAELLERNRREGDSVIEEAIMITIAGIAAGMRNTG